MIEAKNDKDHRGCSNTGCVWTCDLHIAVVPVLGPLWLKVNDQDPQVSLAFVLEVML